MTTAWQPPREGRQDTVTGMTKGMPSLDEIQTLLLAWRPEEAPTDFANRVQRDGILTKETARRVQYLVLQIFQPWFLKPDDPVAQLPGHESVDTTRIYTTPSEQDLQREVEKIALV